MEPLLSFNQVSKTIGNKKILKDMSFNIPTGKIIAFLGQNGAGKTTSLKIASGLMDIDSGEVQFLGKPIDKSKKDVMFIPDYPFLYDELTGEEYIRFTAELFKIRVNKAIIGEKVKYFDLQNEVGKKIKNLSLGNKKKLTLLTTLLNNPKLLLLDEFISGIDPINMKKTKTILRNYVNEGNSILLSTHQLEVAQNFCESLIFINNGEVLQSNIDVAAVTNKDNSLEDYFIRTLSEGVN
jgi:ABC-2 type transport system ATP-binding protein